MRFFLSNIISSLIADLASDYWLSTPKRFVRLLFVRLLSPDAGFVTPSETFRLFAVRSSVVAGRGVCNPVRNVSSVEIHHDKRNFPHGDTHYWVTREELCKKVSIIRESIRNYFLFFMFFLFFVKDIIIKTVQDGITGSVSSNAFIDVIIIVPLISYLAIQNVVFIKPINIVPTKGIRMPIISTLIAKKSPPTKAIVDIFLVSPPIVVSLYNKKR